MPIWLSVADVDRLRDLAEIKCDRGAAPNICRQAALVAVGGDVPENFHIITSIQLGGDPIRLRCSQARTNARTSILSREAASAALVGSTSFRLTLP